MDNEQQEIAFVGMLTIFAELEQKAQEGHPTSQVRDRLTAGCDDTILKKLRDKFPILFTDPVPDSDPGKTSWATGPRGAWWSSSSSSWAWR